MESKKVSKKLNTIFWYVLYGLPLLVFLFYFVGYLAFFKETGSVPADVSVIESCITSVTNVFKNFSWDVIYDTLINTFELVGFTVDSSIAVFIVMLFSWFVQLAFIHLFIDVLLFIPRVLHNLIERWS